MRLNDPAMKRRFIVELLFDKGEQEFQPDRDYTDFEEARLHCALQVSMNPRVLQGRVRDQEASHFPCRHFQDPA